MTIGLNFSVDRSALRTTVLAMSRAAAVGFCPGMTNSVGAENFSNVINVLF